MFGEDEEPDAETMAFQQMLSKKRPYNCSSVVPHPICEPVLPFQAPAPPLEPIMGHMPAPMVKHPKKQPQDGLIPQQYYTITTRPLAADVRHFGNVHDKVELRHLVQFTKHRNPQDSTMEKLSAWLSAAKGVPRIACLVGQPGCGKATLARLLAEKHGQHVVCIKQGCGTLLEAVLAVYNDQASQSRVLLIGQVDVSTDFDTPEGKKQSDKWVSFFKSVASSKAPIRTRVVVTVHSLYSTTKLPHLKHLKKECHVIQAYGRELKHWEARTISDLLLQRCSGQNRAPLYTPTASEAQQVQVNFMNALQSRGGYDISGALQQMSFLYILRPPSTNASKPDVVPNIDSAFSSVKYTINNRWPANPDALEACANVDTAQLTTLVLNNMHSFADACEGPHDDLTALDKMSATLDAAGALDLCPVWSSAHTMVSQGFVATVGTKFPCRFFYKLEWNKRNDEAKAAKEVYHRVHAKLVDMGFSRTWGIFMESVGLLTPSHVGLLARSTASSAAKVALFALMNSTGLLRAEQACDASGMAVVVIAQIGQSAKPPPPPHSLNKRKLDSSIRQETKAQTSTKVQKEPAASNSKKPRKKKIKI